MKEKCCICFDEYEGEGVIKCTNKECLMRICEECTIDYLKFHKTEMNTIPKCPNTNCKEELLYDNLRTFKSTIEIYYGLLYNYLKNNKDYGDYKNEKEMIEKFKMEKVKFMEKTCPKAIKKVIDIALKTKLNSINKQNNLFIKDEIKKANRKCINILCSNGILIIQNDGNYKCNLCDDYFCKSCEKKLRPDHSCKKEDIDSINYINSLVTCPKCFLHIERSYGCNHMTCTNCKTNFDYQTGKKSSTGNNHNIDIHLKKDNHYVPSIQLKEYYDTTINDMFKIIESKKPPTASDIKIKNLLVKLDLQPTEDLKKDLMIKYATFKHSLSKSKKYFTIMRSIYDYHSDKNLNADILQKHISQLS